MHQLPIECHRNPTNEERPLQHFCNFHGKRLVSNQILWHGTREQRNSLTHTRANPEKHQTNWAQKFRPEFVTQKSTRRSWIPDSTPEMLSPHVIVCLWLYRVCVLACPYAPVGPPPPPPMGSGYSLPQPRPYDPCSAMVLLRVAHRQTRLRGHCMQPVAAIVCTGIGSGSARGRSRCRSLTSCCNRKCVLVGALWSSGRGERGGPRSTPWAALRGRARGYYCPGLRGRGN